MISDIELNDLENNRNARSNAGVFCCEIKQICKPKNMQNREQLLDRTTQQGSALYFCLEDSYTRIQSRLYELTDEPTDKLFFSLKADTIGSGLEEQLVKFKSEHDDLQLVVIDTLQMVRSETDSSYGSDYAELIPLKSLAEQLDISIVLVHHLRKAADNDPFNMISGSTGLNGCVDGMLVLKKDKRCGGQAVLYATGRDIEDRNAHH